MEIGMSGHFGKNQDQRRHHIWHVGFDTDAPMLRPYRSATHLGRMIGGSEDRRSADFPALSWKMIQLVTTKSALLQPPHTNVE